MASSGRRKYSRPPANVHPMMTPTYYASLSRSSKPIATAVKRKDIKHKRRPMPLYVLCCSVEILWKRQVFVGSALADDRAGGCGNAVR
jgi:hypothetical protein